MPWFPPELDPLLAVAAAALDENGTLLEANAGFLNLIDKWVPQPIGTGVARFFIQPVFAILVGKNAGADGEIHRGLLTIGNFAERSRSLRGRIRRVAGRLRVLAEYDIEELERLNDTVLALNQDYASAQFARASQFQAATAGGPNSRLVADRPAHRRWQSPSPGTGTRNGNRLCRAHRRGVVRFIADLDHFESVNDTFGHEAGDKVLAAFGDMLRQRTRATDIVTRFGGEEFVVLMPDTDLEKALGVAERCREAFAGVSRRTAAQTSDSSFAAAELIAGEQGSGATSPC